MTTYYGDATLVYDSSSRHVETTVGADTLRYTRGALGAILERDAPGDGAGAEATLRYSSGPAGMGLVLNIGGTVIERTVGLPGGATVTLGVGGERWSYPNLNGSVAAVTDHAGTKIGGTHHYDPYGNPLGELPDNHDGSADTGWMGAGTEHSADFPELIEMGARVYSPELGRFLQVDPIHNGSANGYDYAAGDPINFHDASGLLVEDDSAPQQRPPPVVVSCWGFECGAIANHAYEARQIQSQQNAARASGYADYLAYVAAAAYWAAYADHMQDVWKRSFALSAGTKVAGTAWGDALSTSGLLVGMAATVLIFTPVPGAAVLGVALLGAPLSTAGSFVNCGSDHAVATGVFEYTGAIVGGTGSYALAEYGYSRVANRLFLALLTRMWVTRRPDRPVAGCVRAEGAG